MRIRAISMALAGLAVATLLFPARGHARPFDAAGYVPGELLVKFRAGATAQDRMATVAARSHSTLRRLDDRWLHVKLGEGQGVAEGLAAYGNLPDVEYVQPNYIYRASAVPNDPQYGQLWAYRNTGQTISYPSYTTNNPGTSGNDMNIEKAWDQITDCSGVVVAVVDSGVNHDQQDLAENMWNGGAAYPNHGYDFVNDSDDPMDRNGHGTHVAGIIGGRGNNGKGTLGVCWKASIMAVRVLDATGYGTTAGIVRGVNFAVANDARVINMSLGGGYFDQAFSDAITAAQVADVLVAVAAGNDYLSDNDSGTAPVYPCNYPQPNLVCVAALDQKYQLADFSNFGARSVDVGAPGTNILSSWAGTNGLVTDGLTTGWTRTSTTGGGWSYGTLLMGGYPYRFLLDPGSYPGGSYGNGTDDRVYKTFNLTGVDVAVLNSWGAFDLAYGDYFNAGYSAAGGDPFAGGTVFASVTNLSTYPYLLLGSYDISGGIGPTCSVGFQLKTNAAGTDNGVALTGFSIETLTLDRTSYNTLDGTSMATPEVAGLAAMLFAYNPRFTCADVVEAIRQGGRAVPALAGKTVTGKAVDAISSLSYIRPPTGLTATVE